MIEGPILLTNSRSLLRRAELQGYSSHSTSAVQGYSGHSLLSNLFLLTSLQSPYNVQSPEEAAKLIGKFIKDA